MTDEGTFPKIAGDKVYASEINTFLRDGSSGTNLVIITPDNDDNVSLDITQNDVTNNKSYPDIYLAAAEKIGVSPSDCVIFEDALYAVIGARLAGMRVIGVFERCFANEESKMRTLCDDYILSF